MILATKTPKPEALLQRDIKGLLTTLGYTVMETGKTRSLVACPGCGKKSYASGWQGNTVGLPDLYVHSKDWSGPIAVALELKAAGGKPSEAQQRLAESGLTRIVRSLPEALRVLMSVEQMLGNQAAIVRLEETMKRNLWI